MKNNKKIIQMEGNEVGPEFVNEKTIQTENTNITLP